MTLILEGKTARAAGAARLKEKISGFSVRPRLFVIQVGEKEESNSYIRQKRMFGESIGAEVSHLKFPENVSEAELISKIKQLNFDKTVHGIIVQLPIPSDIGWHKVVDAIKPEKDVDGLTSTNVSARAAGKEAIVPATARGVLELLEFYKIPVAGKKAAVLGRSALVGAPTAEVLSNKGAEVTVCHSQTLNIKEITRFSDIIVVAIGKPKFIGAEYFAAGREQAVVDIGISTVGGEKLENELPKLPKRKIVGDVDFEAVFPLAGAISPVPGGVGLMTVLALFENLVDVYEKQV